MKLFGYSTGCLLPILRRAWAGQYAARRAGLQQAGSGDLGNIESTIANIGRMASEGMKSTDVEILRLMVGSKAVSKQAA